MIRLRPAGERGRTDWGWLDSRHTFSFGEYLDSKHVGFGALRVINDDRVAPGGGFATHGHRDMEILSYVLEGGLEHKDSMGTGSVIRPGEIQFMRAGTGVTHSEHNHSRTEPVHFLQIWIVPERDDLEPGYEQRSVHGAFRLVASRDGRDGSLTVHQDVDLYAGTPAPGFVHDLRPGRHAWIHVANGEVTVNDRRLGEGDGAALTDEPRLRLHTDGPARVLLLDLA